MTDPIIARRIEDFYLEIEPAYHALLNAPGDGPLALDVALAPGLYQGNALGLRDHTNRGRVALTVRALDPDNPPILHDVSIALDGYSVQLEGVVVRNTMAPMMLVALSARTQITLAQCVFVGNRAGGDAPGEPLIKCTPFAAADDAHAVEIADCLFIGNNYSHAGALIACAPMPPTRVARLTCVGTAFLDNACDALIAPGASDAVDVLECMWLASTRTPAQSWVALTYLQTRLRFAACARAQGEGHALASYVAHPPRGPEEYPPVDVVEERVVAQDASVAALKRWRAEAEAGRAPSMELVRAAFGA